MAYCEREGDGSQDMGQDDIRAGYKALMDSITGNQDQLADLNNPKLVAYMETNDELFNKVEAPQEAVLDARVMKQLSRICRAQAEQMSANINAFSQTEFASKLVTNLTGGEPGAGPVSRRKWILLGKQVKGMFRRSPALTYLYSALDTTPLPPKERKPREGRAGQATRLRDLVATQHVVLAQAETSENQTEQMVTHVFKCLVGSWKDLDQQPINLFQFILDPDCFGSTIENLFHVSFLVKEGKASVTVDKESGLPCIAPVARRRQGDQEEVKNQVVLNLCMEDWQRIKRNIPLQEPMIGKVRLQSDGSSSNKKHREV